MFSILIHCGARRRLPYKGCFKSGRYSDSPLEVIFPPLNQDLLKTTTRVLSPRSFRLFISLSVEFYLSRVVISGGQPDIFPAAGGIARASNVFLHTISAIADYSIHTVVAVHELQKQEGVTSKRKKTAWQ